MTLRMHNMLTRAAVIAAAIVLIGAGAAPADDDVKVTATVSPSVVPVGADAILTVKVEGKFRKTSSPELPQLDQFFVYESGTSQNFSFVNGEMAASITYTYTLTARIEGTYVIDPIRFTVKDREYTANPVTVEVTAAQRSVPPPAGSGTPGAADDGDPGRSREDDSSIFITAGVDRDTVYVNQQVTWTLGYYSDGQINLLRSPNYVPPDAEGFWMEDLPPQRKYYTSINDRRFLVNEIKRAYFPTAPGVYEIGPATVEIYVDDARNRSFNDIFSRALRPGLGRAQTLKTESKKIVVLPLPGRGKPEGFAGTVANNVKLSMSADKQVVQVGEPINVTVEVSGTGNMKTVAPPPFELEDFKTYESGSSSDVFKRDYVVSGRKTYDFVVIPKVEGKWTIPSIELPYFDPITRGYKVARSHPIRLDVKPGTREEGRKVIYAGGGDDFEVISQDIRYIHPVPSTLSTTAGRIYNSKVYLGLHVLPMLAVLASLLVERRRKRFREDIGFARASRAYREADRGMADAEKRLREGAVDAALAVLDAALWGYFADKMNVARAGLTSDRVIEFMQQRGTDAETMSDLVSVVRACEAARYAAGSMTADQAARIVAEARPVLRKLEKGSA